MSTEIIATPKTDLAELFSRDPLELTRENIDELIHAMRARRHLFNQGNMQAGKTKPKTAKQKETTTLLEQLDMSKLDINL